MTNIEDKIKEIAMATNELRNSEEPTLFYKEINSDIEYIKARCHLEGLHTEELLTLYSNKLYELKHV